MSQNNIFAKNLKALIIADGNTVKNLSKKLNIDKYQLYHWSSENYFYLPKIESILKLADYFNCTVDYLFGINAKMQFISKDSPKSIYEKIVTISGYSNITLNKLAKDCNMKNTSFYEWRDEKVTPSISSLIKVCRVLNCSLDYLLGR